MKKGMFLNRQKIYLLFLMLFATVYAFWLSSLASSLFRDRENYLIYAQYSGLRLEVIPKEFLIFYEPLFLVVNEVLYRLFGNPELNITLIVFFISFTLFFISFYKTRYFVTGLMLLSLFYFQTQTLALQLVTIRQGLALSVFLFTTLIFKKRSHILYSLIVCGLIHNSFIIMALFYGVYLYIQNKKKWSKNKKKLLFIAFSLCFSFMFFFLLSFISTKQNYSGFRFSSGGGAFLLWTLVLLYILFFKSSRQNTFYKQLLYDFSIIGLILYSTGYFLTPLSGRMIGSFVPFIGLLLLAENKLQDLMVFVVLLTVNVYLYINGAFEGFLLVTLEEFHNNLF